MRTAAYLSLLLIAATRPLPSPRILPLLTAAIRAAPESMSPSPSAVRRLLGSLYADPKRTADRDTEWLRFNSTDRTCEVELGPIVDGRVLKLTVSCEFPARSLAIDFLHDMVTATQTDWQPPVFYNLDGEIAHIGVIMKRLPVGAEAYLQRAEGERWRAAVVLTAGGRAVTPLKSSKGSPPLPRTSF